MEHTKEIIPDVSLFGKLGARSRAFPMVVTELVDNSLDSWIGLPASKRTGELSVEISATQGRDAWFTIKDNAGGMTMDELINALTVAKSDKGSSSKFIGHFGLGLKSAAMYIGKKFRIFTISHKSPSKVSYVEFDRDKFEKSGKWELKFEELKKNEVAKLGVYFKKGHGTEIQIRNDRYRSANKKGILNRLQKTFAPRLPKHPKLKIGDPKKSGRVSEKMRITFNEEEVFAAGAFYEPWDNSVRNVEKETAELLKRIKRDKREISNISTDFIKGKQHDVAVIPSTIKWLTKIPSIIDIPEKKIGDRRVSGRIGILDRGMAHNNKYGIDLIKNGRVIEENVIDRDLKSRDVGLMASNHNARIAGQLFLDDWQTDHQKTSFLKDSKDWAALTDYVGSYVKQLHQVSSLLQNPKKNFQGKSDYIDKNSPEVIADKKVESKIPQLTKSMQQAVRGTAVKTAIQDLEEARKTAPAPRKKATTKKAESTTSLIFTKTEIKFSRLGDEAPMVFSKLVKEGSSNILKITLNRDHPFLAERESAELTAIGEFLAVDRFTGYVMKNKELLKHEDFIKLRDTMLRELSLKLR